MDSLDLLGQASATLSSSLASPPILLSLALLLFFAARNARWVWTVGGGVATLVISVAMIALAAQPAELQSELLDPQRLPITVTLAASALVLWLEMRKARQRLPADHGANPNEPIPDMLSLRAREADLLLASAIGLAVVGAAAVSPPPLGAAAGVSSSPTRVETPWMFTGWQELTRYFAPWWSLGILPLLIFGGLFLLPFLRTTGIAGAARRRAFFLAAWLFLWLGPMTAGGLLNRTPTLAAPTALSEKLWIEMLQVLEPSNWLLRELPGFALLIGYVVLLPRLLIRWSATRSVFSRYREAMGTWRFHIAVLWTLTLGLVPLKIYSLWLFNVDTWISLPEIGLRF